MSNFPKILYDDFEEWIPVEDIEGTLAKRTILSKANNIDFKQGWIENARKPKEKTLPSLILTDISNGYNILSVIHFYHVTRKNCFFYILGENKAGVNVKFYIEELDNSLTSLLVPDDDVIGGNFTFKELPKDISYSFVENQLKVNTNAIATYKNITLSKQGVIANFTLFYREEEVVYHTNYRSGTGWSFPLRWLGFKGVTTNEVYDLSISGSSVLTLDKDTLGSFPNLTSKNTTAGTTNIEITPEGWIKISNIKSLSYITIDFGISSIGKKVGINGNTYTIESKLVSQSFNPIPFFDFDILSANSITYIPSIKITPNGSEILITNEEEVDTLFIYQVIFHGAQANISILGRNFDGQRGLVWEYSSSYIHLPIFETGSSYTFRIKLSAERIDYRIKYYELYFKLADENIYYKVGEIDINNNFTETATYLEKDIAPNIADTRLETANFNYGISPSKDVYKVDTNASNSFGINELLGDYIYSEVQYRGRDYYVKDTEKVYFSHLSGTGKPQPDSFPVDEDIDFGYFMQGRNDINKSVAITPMDELLILTKDKSYIYIIQSNGVGTPYRKLRTVNGNTGILNKNAVLSNINGSLYAPILFWVDLYGMYLYAGGVNPPKNIALGKIYNYWLALGSYRETAIVLFNKAKNEIWVSINNGSLILVYEIDYNRFRTYSFAQEYIEQFIGIYNEMTYWFGNNKIHYYDNNSNNEFLSAYFSTHYSTDNEFDARGYPLKSNEIQDKILQELYLITKDKPTNNSYWTVTVDITTDKEIDKTVFSFSSNPSVYLANEKVLNILTPLLIRYKSIKINFTIQQTNEMLKLSKIGYSYSIVHQNRGTEIIRVGTQ